MRNKLIKLALGASFASSLFALQGCSMNPAIGEDSFSCQSGHLGGAACVSARDIYNNTAEKSFLTEEDGKRIYREKMLKEGFLEIYMGCEADASNCPPEKLKTVFKKPSKVDEGDVEVIRVNGSQYRLQEVTFNGASNNYLPSNSYQNSQSVTQMVSGQKAVDSDIINSYLYGDKMSQTRKETLMDPLDPSVIRTPAKVMRVSIAPWVDKNERLHYPQTILVEVEQKRWEMGEDPVFKARSIKPLMVKRLNTIPSEHPQQPKTAHSMNIDPNKLAQDYVTDQAAKIDHTDLTKGGMPPQILR